MSTFLKWKILIGNTCTGNATFPHHSQVWKWWWWEGQEMIWISFSGLSIRVSVSLLIRHQQTQSQQLKINITNQHSHSWMKTLKIKKIICWARHTLTLKWSQYLKFNFINNLSMPCPLCTLGCGGKGVLQGTANQNFIKCCHYCILYYICCGLSPLLQIIHNISSL